MTWQKLVYRALWNLHDFKACSARIIASWRCHSAGVIANVTWPSLANCEGASANGHTASAARKDSSTTAIPPEAAAGTEHVQSVLYSIPDSQKHGVHGVERRSMHVHIQINTLVACWYLMLTLESCVALHSRTAVVPLITRWSVGSTEITVRPAKYPARRRKKGKRKRKTKVRDI